MVIIFWIYVGKSLMHILLFVLCTFLWSMERLEFVPFCKIWGKQRMKLIRQQVKDSRLEYGWFSSPNIIFFSTSGSVFFSSDIMVNKWNLLLEKSSRWEVRGPNNEENNQTKNQLDTRVPHGKVSLMFGDYSRLTNEVQMSKLKVTERKPLK